jgi:hypothetical protein
MPEAARALSAPTAAVLLLKLLLPRLLVLACAQKIPMVPVLSLAVLALPTPPRLLDLFTKRLACARLTSTEMPKALSSLSARLVLMVEQLLLLKRQDPSFSPLLAYALPASMEMVPPAQLVAMVPPLQAERQILTLQFALAPQANTEAIYLLVAQIALMVPPPLVELLTLALLLACALPTITEQATALYALFAPTVAPLLPKHQRQQPLLSLPIAPALSTPMPLMQPTPLADAPLVLLAVLVVVASLTLLIASALSTLTEPPTILHALLAQMKALPLLLGKLLWVPASALSTPMLPTGQVPMVLTDALLA